LVLEVLKSLQTYHLGYQASFRYPARARLPLLRQQVLATAAPDDPLHRHLAEAVGLIPDAATQSVASMRSEDGLADLVGAITGFLNDSP
jgi:hypothetical protein